MQLPKIDYNLEGRFKLFCSFVDFCLTKEIYVVKVIEDRYNINAFVFLLVLSGNYAFYYASGN